MRGALLAGWQETVSQDELAICLGDVTIGPALPAVDEAPAAPPGTKMVIAGNHDFAPLRPAPKNYSLEAVYPTLVCETDPTLLLTHEALDTVRPTASTSTGTGTAQPARRGRRATWT